MVPWRSTPSRNFEGRFAEQILPDQLHILNVSFLVPSLRRDFGGCAGNIAYSLKLLGGEPRPWPRWEQTVASICSAWLRWVSVTAT